MVLKEKSAEALEYVKAHDGCTTREMMDAFGLEKINGITGRVNSLVKNGFVETKSEGVDPDGHKITRVYVTDAGMNYVPTEDAE